MTHDDEDEPDIKKRDIADNAYIGFSIKARDTEANRIIHKAFKEGAKKYTDNDYTQYLRRLLERAQEDYKYKAFHRRLDEFEERLMAIESALFSDDSDYIDSDDDDERTSF